MTQAPTRHRIKMKRIYNKRAYHFFARPFQENLEMTLVLWILAGSADLFFWTIHHFETSDVNLFFGVYMFLHSYVQVYFIVLICGLLKGVIFNIAKWTLYALGLINLCVDTGVHTIMKCGFLQEFVAIIMGTNAGETREFIGMYLNSTMIVFVTLALFLIGFIYFLLSRIKKRNWIAVLGLSSIIVCSLVIFARKSHNWDGVFLMKIKTCLSYKPSPDLKNYSHRYFLTNSNECEPQNIVLLIGESLNKGHMSAYGYSKKTTPFIDSLRLQENIFIYDNVSSSAIGTISSFTYMMTSSCESNQKDITESCYLADIINSAGYKTRWISNQSSSGIHDNVVAKFAELNDTVIWCGTKFTGITKMDLDENVLEPTKILSNQDTCKTFTVVHLMGSHENFNSRFPNEFAKFHASDYSTYPNNQRQILADYDNSVLYNDYIVSQIIDIYKDKEAIIIYLPDHSLDIFDSSPDYAGHARSNNATSVTAGKNIPFIIYTTKKYSNKYPDMVERIKNSIHNRFESENLMYTIMDIMGVEFADREPCVEKYSLFRSCNE